MGQLVHRKGEFDALLRKLRLGGAGILQAGIEHQRIQGRAALQQLAADALNGSEIGQIADQGANRTGELAQGLISRGLIAAEDRERMPPGAENLRGLETHAGAGSGEQHTQGCGVSHAA